MTDIVTRLRDPDSRPSWEAADTQAREAADTIERMRSALRVIHTWASFDMEHGGLPRTLDPRQTRDLCAKALEIEP